jgi:hypothetical protein
MKHAFANAGVAMRDESRTVEGTAVQYLLVKRLTRLLVALLRVCVFEHDSESWVLASNSIAELRDAPRPILCGAAKSRQN